MVIFAVYNNNNNRIFQSNAVLIQIVPIRTRFIAATIMFMILVFLANHTKSISELAAVICSRKFTLSASSTICGH